MLILVAQELPRPRRRAEPKDNAAGTLAVVGDNKDTVDAEKKVGVGEGVDEYPTSFLGIELCDRLKKRKFQAMWDSIEPQIKQQNEEAWCASQCVHLDQIMWMIVITF